VASTLSNTSISSESKATNKKKPNNDDRGRYYKNGEKFIEPRFISRGNEGQKKLVLNQRKFDIKSMERKLKLIKLSITNVEGNLEIYSDMDDNDDKVKALEDVEKKFYESLLSHCPELTNIILAKQRASKVSKKNTTNQQINNNGIIFINVDLIPSLDAI